MKVHLSMLVTLGAAVSLMTACGGHKSGSGDKVAPVLVETHPADGSTEVSVNQPIELVFDEPVSIDDAQLHLSRRGATAAVPMEVTVDENVVTVRPFEPLTYAQLYTLSVAGITDLSANEGDSASVEFRASMSPVSVQVNYSMGVTSSMTVYDNDTDGFALGYDHLSDPGVDGQWLTSDDVILDYYVWARDELGQRVSERRYADPGPDAVFHTSDDVATSLRTFEYDDNGFLVESIYRSDAGPDGVFETADDTITTVIQNELDGQGLPYRYINLGPGTDGVYFTSDDEPYFYNEATHDADGHTIDFRTAGSSGTDGVWFTDDDFDTATFYTFDAQGRPTQAAESSNPGTDGVFGTSDDVIDYTTVTTYDAQGRAWQSITRNSADVATYLETLERDANGNLVLWTQYLDAGTDGVPFTADDTIDGFSEYSYSTDGNRIDDTHYVDPGSDSLWHTGDDLPSIAHLY